MTDTTVPGRDDLPNSDEQSPTLRARFRAVRNDEDVRSAARGAALFVGGLALNAPVTIGVTAGLAVKAMLDKDKDKTETAAKV